MSATYSHSSVFRIGPTARGRLLFPGSTSYQEESMGYVRAHARAARALHVRRGRMSISTPLPWRDYALDVLTESREVFDKAGFGNYTGERLLVSARNVLNEFGHRVRIAGRWYGRAGDPPIDGQWPVFEVSERHAGFRPLSRAGSGDVLTGVPVVRGGVPTDRDHLVAWCSDQSHVFDVHPRGLRGPSSASREQRADAWTRLSDGWQQAKDEELPDHLVARQQEELARELGVAPSRDVLHSILGQCANGDLIAFCAVGSFDRLARTLVDTFTVTEAIVLDNGGSVGPAYVPAHASTGQLLLAAPNRRSAGTVFIDFWIEGFLHPSVVIPDRLDSLRDP